jgi:Tfp pilus assembly protein PilF
MNYDETYDLALEKYHEKNYDESIKLLNKILEEDDTHYHSWHLLGNIFFNLEDLDAAKDFFLAAINKQSDFFDAYYMLANVLFKAKHFEDAISIWEEGLKHNPSFALSYANIAISYDRLEKKEEAIFYAKKAISIDKNCFEAHFCLAKIYQSKQDLKITQTHLEEVLKIDPLNTLANFDLSYIYLSKGLYEKGFKLFETRKQMPNREHEYNYLPFKEYTNEDLENKCLLLYHEQGFGDNIQFIRFLNNTKIKGLSVGIQNPLNKLFSYNFPKVEFLDTVDSAMDFDYMSALMSLPHILETNKVSNKAYLDVDKSDLEKYKKKNLDKNKFNIGLVWKGSTANKDKDIKSLNLKQLDSILAKQKCNFYNLQIENYQEIENYHIKNIGKEFKDFYDTALAIKSMDLVIGIDTAVSHLAGALGIETCLIYSNNTIDFRWSCNENSKSSWYESVTIYTPEEIDLINKKIDSLLKDKI